MNKIKKIHYIIGLILLITIVAFNQRNETPTRFEFTSFTVVESIIPNGIGRSRIINSLELRDHKEYTSIKSPGLKSRNKSDRQEIRANEYEETKLLNFFNVVGIRFQNIAANDALINDKVSAMLNDGWELVNIVAGVESVGSEDDKNGIYITRFYFKCSN